MDASSSASALASFPKRTQLSISRPYRPTAPTPFSATGMNITLSSALGPDAATESPSRARDADPSASRRAGLSESASDVLGRGARVSDNSDNRNTARFTSPASPTAPHTATSFASGSYVTEYT